MDCTCFNNQHFTMAAKSKTKIDLKWRKSLDVGSKCEYKSKSDNKWIPAIISRIFRDEKNKEWIKINYGNPKRKKEMKRFAKCIRPISMQKASKCKEKGRNQSFDKKSLLITHGAVHSKAKPFECEKCGKSYKLKGDLHAHTRKCYNKSCQRRSN